MNSRISPWRIGRWSASATMIAAFGNDQTALVMYDTQAVPAAGAYLAGGLI